MPNPLDPAVVRSRCKEERATQHDVGEDRPSSLIELGQVERVRTRRGTTQPRYSHPPWKIFHSLNARMYARIFSFIASEASDAIESPYHVAKVDLLCPSPRIDVMPLVAKASSISSTR